MESRICKLRVTRSQSSVGEMRGTFEMGNRSNIFINVNYDEALKFKNISIVCSLQKRELAYQSVAKYLLKNGLYLCKI